jgi:sugar phosphate isomerase/epimerase
MELAVITDEISQDLDHSLDVMAEYGIAYAEIRGAWGTNIADASDELVQRIKSSAKRHDTKIIGIATPVFKCDLPQSLKEPSLQETPSYGAAERTYDDQIPLLERCIDIALMLGAKLIRVFTFYRNGELTQEIEDYIVEAFREPAKLAAAAGVVLLVENEHSCYTGTGVETAHLLARVASPAVKSVWDPGNAVMASEMAFPVGYQAIKRYVAHVHVKDATNGHKWTVVGEGDIDWLGQIRALKADGYTGYLSLETHYKGGGDPETSSRQCLDGLFKILELV